MVARNTQTIISKLTKDNYDNWCIEMRAFLGAQGTSYMPKDGYEESNSKEPKVAMTKAQCTIFRLDRKKDCKAKSIIYQGLNEDTFELL